MLRLGEGLIALFIVTVVVVGVVVVVVVVVAITVVVIILSAGMRTRHPPHKWQEDPSRISRAYGWVQPGLGSSLGYGKNSWRQTV